MNNFLTENLEKIKELSEKITQTESALSVFFNLCPMLFTIANSKGYFCKVNDQWEKQFGWTSNELCSHPYIYFIHPDDIEKTHEAEKTLKEEGKLKNFSNRYRCKDGSYKRISWDCSPYIDGIYTYNTSHVIEDPA
jgi:PAS domain S-box-containing protein